MSAPDWRVIWVLTNTADKYTPDDRREALKLDTLVKLGYAMAEQLRREGEP